jgi:hypothetical protein
LTAAGTVLRIIHAYHVFVGFVIDGQFGRAVAVHVGTAATGLVLRDVEIRRAARDCLDLADPRDVVIDGALVHHCLDASRGRRDAHGIAAGAVRNLTVRNTEVHTFSGDAIQLDPRRGAPGWNDVTIEGCRFWLAPLSEDIAGFRAGRVPGENAVDTKTFTGKERSRIVIRNTIARGFRGSISNQAAFNLKEYIDAFLDQVTVSASDVAFRVRGQQDGARATITNALVYDVGTAVRYEDGAPRLRLWNATFGLAVGRLFQSAGTPTSGIDVRNLLVIAPRLPAEAAAGGHNLAVDANTFVDAAAADYHLLPEGRGVDAGEALPEVSHDRDGVARPQGRAWDVGAYERSSTACSDTAAPSQASTTTFQPSGRRGVCAADAARDPCSASRPGSAAHAGRKPAAAHGAPVR